MIDVCLEDKLFEDYWEFKYQGNINAAMIRAYRLYKLYGAKITDLKSALRKISIHVCSSNPPSLAQYSVASKS